ncbi:DUF659 domain-containing protein [Mycena venus]|uniref:DUF659 domain-containing protein n=1 Tax=Mycena venus TaxID=2733690 RepID=A0A8H6Z963_9AGAR|nr:DUF659 domain-containing protein [Mycena venus]
MAVETMEKTGKIRSHLSYQLYEQARAAGKATHRKHNHMHTSEATGIDTILAKDLENPVTWIPPLEGASDETDRDEDIVQKASEELQSTLNDEEPGPISIASVTGGELVDFKELDRVDNGQAATMAEDSIDVVGGNVGAGWDIEDLM